MCIRDRCCSSARRFCGGAKKATRVWFRRQHGWAHVLTACDFVNGGRFNIVVKLAMGVDTATSVENGSAQFLNE